MFLLLLIVGYLRRSYVQEGMSLDEIVAKEVVQLPVNQELIAMKLIPGADPLKSRMKKAVQDFDNAIKLFGKLSALQFEPVDFGTAYGSKFSWACFNPTYWSPKPPEIVPLP